MIGSALTGTFLGVLLIPVFYVSMRRLLGDRVAGDTGCARESFKGTSNNQRR